MTGQPCIHFVEAGNIPPANIDDGDEIWWMEHYACDCGWRSDEDEVDPPDAGRELAEQHSTETGHPFCEEQS